MAAVNSKLQQGLAFHNRGQLDRAEVIYREVLAIAPDDFDALHLMGMLEGQRGNATGAVDWMSQALRINPHAASAHSNLGVALLELNRPEEALASFDRALALKPEFVDALNGQGIALIQLQRPERALPSFDRALALRPDLAIALYGRGNALFQLERLDEALVSYDRVLMQMPAHLEALKDRGDVLLQLKRPDEALASYDKALAINPKHAQVMNNRGNALQKLWRLAEAIASYDKAISISAKYPEAHYNRGNALWQVKRHDEALASYDRAIALRPDYPRAFYSRGNLLREMNRHEDALKSFQRLIEISPGFDYAPGDRLFAQLFCCDWTQFEERVTGIAHKARTGARVATPFTLLAISDSAADQLLCSQLLISDKFPAASQPVWRGERYRHDRIRLAFLSADFRVHPSSFLLAGMFEQHDRSRFETIAISFGDDDQSEIRARLKGAFEHFIDVRGNSDPEVARLLREREVDIAVDLMGHTQYARMGIFALRPAPVQVNFFCPGTSGTDYLDYIVCDRVVIPQDHHAHYSEKVVYLPDTFQANDTKRRIAERTPSRAEAGLPDNGFVFCSFNQTYKFTPGMFDVWMRLLDRVEGSVLWLQQANATAVKNLRREAGQRGVDPNRLVFAPRVPRLEDHLARYRLADLFLDTLPYNAQTTASDALWAGLPVITCLGTTFVGRVAASLLNAIGLPQLITHSLPEYEALAIKLATERETLADIKASLARNRDSFPLFDTDRFRRHIEAAYVEMWERHQRGAPPASFSVQPVRKDA